jgi:indole-3-glycerol phosphate synthase
MLDQIVAYKAAQLLKLDYNRELEKIMTQIPSMRPTISLKESLSNNQNISIIAEIKRRSPSKGTLAENLNAVKTAQIYESAGAQAISVLTESEFFNGNPDDLKAVREISNLPLLRKDFILDEYQVWESRAIGADAILVIVAILNNDRLTSIYSLARQIDLDVIVEVHNEEELHTALALNPEIIGINNRNLKTFETDLETTECLSSLIPPGVLQISESGIKTRADIKKLEKYNIDAVLIGEELVKSPDPFRKLHQLMGITDDEN